MNEKLSNHIQSKIQQLHDEIIEECRQTVRMYDNGYTGEDNDDWNRIRELQTKLFNTLNEYQNLEDAKTMVNTLENYDQLQDIMIDINRLSLETFNTVFNEWCELPGN